MGPRIKSEDDTEFAVSLECNRSHQVNGQELGFRPSC